MPFVRAPMHPTRIALAERECSPSSSNTLVPRIGMDDPLAMQHRHGFQPVSRGGPAAPRFTQDPSLTSIPVAAVRSTRRSKLRPGII